MTTSVLWFRRDLRLGDNPALLAARDHGEHVLPLFVLDPTLQKASGANRLAFLEGCLRELHERTDGKLRVVEGDPVTVVPRVAKEAGAETVHVAADYGPYGHQRDKDVEKALHDKEIELVRTGCAYAVAPGTVLNGSGKPFQVFTPFSRAWQAKGWPKPAATPREVPWTDGGLKTARIGSTKTDADLPEPGEHAALQRFHAFAKGDLDDYHEGRNDLAGDSTSRLSAYLKYGCIHPRTVLEGLGRGKGSEVYRSEIAWREFYADVLFQRPDAIRTAIHPEFDRMKWDRDEKLFHAWQQGRTGFPIVDAGMRQLLAEGWIHNRARMVVGSFLVKDLHLDWRRGARHFMDHLVDGDVASNQLGWQWVAGSGTDAAPFFRVFNPVLQGEKFDPDGDYVRRYVPELAGVPGKAVHQPWALPGGVPKGYPGPVVDHKEERDEALARYQEIRK